MISELERGKRKYVTTAELMVLAVALGCDSGRAVSKRQDVGTGW
jgi:hypothetical protein